MTALFSGLLTVLLSAGACFPDLTAPAAPTLADEDAS